MKNPYQEHQNPLGYHEAAPKPSPAELSEHYRNKYYQQAQGSYAPSYLPEELRHFRNVAVIAEEMARRFGLDRCVLDLGCGEGFFSGAFQSFGWSVSCCDYSEFGITKHNPVLLPHFVAGDMADAIGTYRSNGQTFGLVNLQNVLEHVIDPVALLAEIKPLMSAASAVRIRVPNDYSDFQLALVDKGCTINTWFNAPEHLSYFNNEGLAKLLVSVGYRILSLQADFPIELFLANPHSNYWKDRSLGKGAHLARVFCENHLIEKDVTAYIEYSEAAARLGFGRELIAYATLV